MSKKTQDTPTGLRIRMYRVGFGDCFLVSFPVDGDYRHILIDCGVHARGDIHTMKDIIANIAQETQKQLVVVIATHAHQDHISGFGSGADTFKGFSVGEVWMPWTEDPADDLASRLRRKRNALALALADHFALAGGSAEALAAVQNISGNQAPLQLLHSGFNGKARVRYLEAGDELSSVTGIPGLSVKVLGPPRDQEFLSRMDPPASQRYLQPGADGAARFQNVVVPFSAKWARKRNDPLVEPVRMRPVEEKHLQQKLADLSLEELAFTLDQALNNTSVVTLMSFSGQKLLFPGDAQYGNWKFWLQQKSSDELLAGIQFYKVAHHGSFNATPKGALQKMAPGGFAAMASTQSVPWKSIPRMPLMRALEAQTKRKLVRSDSLVIKGAPKGPTMGKLPSGFRKGPFWYDYVVSV